MSNPQSASQSVPKVIYVNSLLNWTSGELFRRVQVRMANNLYLAEGETHKKPIAQKHLPFHENVQPTEAAIPSLLIYIYFSVLWHFKWISLYRLIKDMLGFRRRVFA